MKIYNWCLVILLAVMLAYCIQNQADDPQSVSGMTFWMGCGVPKGAIYDLVNCSISETCRSVKQCYDTVKDKAEKCKVSGKAVGIWIDIAPDIKKVNKATLAKWVELSKETITFIKTFDSVDTIEISLQKMVEAVSGIEARIN